MLLHRDGGVSACGKNKCGQLGLGDAQERRAPARLAGVADVVAVAAGYDHTVLGCR